MSSCRNSEPRADFPDGGTESGISGSQSEQHCFTFFILSPSILPLHRPSLLPHKRRSLISLISSVLQTSCNTISLIFIVNRHLNGAQVHALQRVLVKSSGWCSRVLIILLLICLPFLLRLFDRHSSLTTHNQYSLLTPGQAFQHTLVLNLVPWGSSTFLALSDF